jgi:peroxiredoxin
MSVSIREQSDELKAAAAARLPVAVAVVFDDNARQMGLQGIPSAAIKVGDKMDSFTLRNAIGELVTLDELAAGGPVVIVFYRGGWCPYCDLALRTYQQDLLPQLKGFDANLVAISPQTPDQSLSTAHKAALEFEVLSDPGSRFAKRIGIAFDQPPRVLAAQRHLGLDLAEVNDEASTTLPMPTVVILDTDRIARFVDVQPDYTARTEVAEILDALAAMRPGPGLNPQ